MNLKFKNEFDRLTAEQRLTAESESANLTQRLYAYLEENESDFNFDLDGKIESDEISNLIPSDLGKMTKDQIISVISEISQICDDAKNRRYVETRKLCHVAFDYFSSLNLKNYSVRKAVLRFVIRYKNTKGFSIQFQNETDENTVGKIEYMSNGKTAYVNFKNSRFSLSGLRSSFNSCDTANSVVKRANSADTFISEYDVNEIISFLFSKGIDKIFLESNKTNKAVLSNFLIGFGSNIEKFKVAAKNFDTDK